MNTWDIKNTRRKTMNVLRPHYSVAETELRRPVGLEKKKRRHVTKGRIELRWPPRGETCGSERTQKGISALGIGRKKRLKRVLAMQIEKGEYSLQTIWFRQKKSLGDMEES